MDVLTSQYNRMIASWRGKHIASDVDLDRELSAYRIRYAYNSGRIENQSITYHDTREVFENGALVGYSGDVRSLFEIQNLKRSYDFMIDAFGRAARIDESMVLEWHRVLTEGTYDERRWRMGERPGSYKRNAYVVGAMDAGLPPEAVGEGVRSLLAELDAATPDNILTVAAYFHASFEAIHPFADGNGRCGRELMNYLFVTHGHPPIIVFDDDKLSYYGAMEVWDAEGDLEPMKLFLKAELVKTWDSIL